MTRKVTIVYDLPEELCRLLEKQAAEQGRRLQDVLVEHLAQNRGPRPAMNDEERERRRAAFERHFGEWDGGDASASDNDRIEADLAREHSGDGAQGS